MNKKTETIDAWTGQVEDKVRQIVKTKWSRDYLMGTEQLMLDWTREKGFDRLDNERQFEYLVKEYGHELPENIIEGLAENVVGFATPQYCDQTDREWKRYLMCELQEDVDGFTAEFFEVFVDEFPDYVVRFSLELKNEKGHSCYGTLQFRLSDLNLRLDQVDDVDDWAELIRNETRFDVDIYLEHGIHIG